MSAHPILPNFASASGSERVFGAPLEGDRGSRAGGVYALLRSGCGGGGDRLSEDGGLLVGGDSAEVAEIDLVVIAHHLEPLAGNELVMHLREYLCFVFEGAHGEWLHGPPPGPRL